MAVPTHATSKVRRTGALYQRQARSAFLLLAPTILFFAVLVYYPMIQSFVMSFTNWDLFKDTYRFIGIDNYKRLLTDRTFRTSVRNTFVYSVSTVGVGTSLALFLANLLNRDIKGSHVYRFIYYIPVISPLVASAVIWEWLYNPSQGLINYLLSLVGVHRIGWLVDPHYSLAGVIIMSIWGSLGFNMLIFLAGLKGIPEVFYDAAKVDGANGWQRFVHVTWPLLRPVTIFVIVTSTISAFKVFGQVYVMTNGGPVNSTRVIVFDIYETAFRMQKLGYASSMSYFLLGILLLLTMLQMRAGRSDY